MPSKKKDDQLKEEKTTKTTPTKKATSTRKSASKVASSKTKEDAKKVTKKTTSKSGTKTDTKKKTAKTTTKTKKTSTSRKTTKATTKKTTPKKSTEKDIPIIEHYDLPYRYNHTIVKVLAQTPTRLFVYWDVANEDIEHLKENYGPDFLNNTKPVLIIKNDSMNYSFEVDVDDFANGWYINVNDANCNYSVELGRRAKYYNEDRHIDIPNNYIYISSSNEMSAPNDRVLFNKNLSTVYFKDVKTNIVTAEHVSSISFMRHIKELYNLCCSSEDYLISGDNDLKLDLRNPSSGNPSSTFK